MSFLKTIKILSSKQAPVRNYVRSLKSKESVWSKLVAKSRQFEEKQVVVKNDDSCALCISEKPAEDLETNVEKAPVKVEDTMPDFTTVEQRMMDLEERKLHPHYKRFQNITRRDSLLAKLDTPYCCKCGPIEPKDIPKHFKFNCDLLKCVNEYSDLKIVEPSRSLTAKIVEIHQNRKRSMEPRNEESLNAPSPALTKIYHTLHQDYIKE